MKLIILGAVGAGLYLAMRADDGSPDTGGWSSNTPGPTDTPGRVPRGIRNNNPGNIEKGDAWQGLAADQSGDERFAVFTDPVWGIRALAKTLLTYRTRYGIRTPREIISRWAPSVENDTGAYVEHVASVAGIGPDEPVTDDKLPLVVTAIIQHENGVQPYPADLISEGIARAYA